MTTVRVIEKPQTPPPGRTNPAIYAEVTTGGGARPDGPAVATGYVADATRSRKGVSND